MSSVNKQIMASDNISEESNEENFCNICYDDACDDIPLIILECCNKTKKICVKCVNCLKTPICPYCRKPLDSKCVPFMNETALLSSSEPTRSQTSFLTWENFLSQENIIDPSLYDDSRRMRRMMRRLRYQYRQINSNSSTNFHHGLSRQQRRNYHRTQRENNRNIARVAMDLHNNFGLYDDIFFME